MQAKMRDVLRATRGIVLMAGTAIGYVAVLNVAVQARYSSPHLGDMLAFDPDPNISESELGLRLLVHRAHQFGCVLDMNTIRHVGGSLIIESRNPAGLYHLHWAGPRTSPDNADCGTRADLIVDAKDLARLAVAAAQPQALTLDPSVQQ
jgi:hypothetical protein